MKYEKLFQKGRIGTMELKNRIAMSPAGIGLGGMNGELNEDLIRYYEERAKGGCGLISTGITVVDDKTGVVQNIQPWATSEKHLPGMIKFADRMHRYGTMAVMELGHPGRQTLSVLNNGNQPIAPSAIPCPIMQEMPREATVDDIYEIEDKFAASAELCKRAGLDGVIVHAAHGYLIQQFMSPWSNKRTDEYGGSFENRMRFAKEIIEKIQAVCGKRFPIIVRMTGNEYIDGGLTLDDGIQIAKYLESLGVAALDISCSSYITGKYHCESQFFTEGWRKVNAKTIKANVSIPILATNTIKHPQFAESLLEEGVSDYVDVLRGQIADPEWANKALQGRDDTIRTCISCMNCMLMDNRSMPVSCTANPWACRETVYNEDTLKRDGAGRKVAVIGGGPAGMHAAIILAKRGYHAILFEKNDRLGGTMIAAATLERKTYMRELLAELRREVERSGVEVRLNSKADPEEILKMDLYGVMVSAGGTPIIPPIPGIQQENVYKATDVLLGKVQLRGEHVAVIGGGDTGLETTEFLCGTHTVHLIEMMDVVGPEMYHDTLDDLLEKVTSNGATIHTATALKEIRPASILARNMADGTEIEIPADSVVLALGVRSCRLDWSKVEEKFGHFTYIGDANSPGNIVKAMRSANDRAFVL